MIAMFCLPPTVLRSAAECPCTSALGLMTRRYSADKSKASPPSNDTASMRPLSFSRISVGHGSFVMTYAGLFKRSWPGLAPAIHGGMKHMSASCPAQCRVSGAECWRSSQREIEVAELLDASGDLVAGF